MRARLGNNSRFLPAIVPLEPLGQVQVLGEDVRLSAMRIHLPLCTLAAVVLSGAFAWPALSRRRENERRRALNGVPQAERALRVPSRRALEDAIPGSARSILEQSKQLTLLSLEPQASFGRAKRPFHDHEVLGRLILSGQDKAALIASFYDGLAPARADISLGCFSPRHGLRAVKDGRALDLLICFSCRQFIASVNGKQVGYYQFISNSPQPMFNQALANAGIRVK